MKKRSVVYKLFGITLIFFTILLGFNLLIQSIFLEKYYMKKKIEKIQSDIEVFSRDYMSKSLKLTETMENIDFFIEKNNSPMIIVDETGKIKHKNTYGNILLMKSKMGEFYTVKLNELIADTNYRPKIGDEIKIDGTIFMEEKIFRDILKMEINGEKYYNEKLIKSIHNDIHNNNFPLGVSIVEVRGKIIYINDRVDYKQDKYMSYKNNTLIGEIESVFLTNKFSINEIEDDKILSYEFLDPSFNNKNMIFIKPLIRDKENRTFIFVITPFQPINEALDIMGDFNIYIFLFALILIIILSFIYSKMISSPLLKINEVAERMASLDFSVKCKINSKDELGNLSKSINTMSTNLNNSLKNLKMANEKLTDDIERERIQEEKRRQFIANVSHELKTPLGIIKGFAEGIKDGIYESKKDYYLGVIIDEIEKMDELVLDMLTISKLETMKYRLNMKKFYIDDLVNRLIEKYTHIFEEKDLKVNCFFKHFKVYGDEDKIYRVIDNLLSNAVKYSKNREKINIKMKGCEELIFFYIENTGTHIPDSETDKIWDRFYRLERSRNRLSGGTGLGLNIVKNILEFHKSEYGVRNTKHGVEFYFSLPKIN